MSGALGVREILGLRFILLYLGAFTSVFDFPGFRSPVLVMDLQKSVCMCVCM